MLVQEGPSALVDERLIDEGLIDEVLVDEVLVDEGHLYLKGTREYGILHY